MKTLIYPIIPVAMLMGFFIGQYAERQKPMPPIIMPAAPTPEIKYVPRVFYVTPIPRPTPYGTWMFDPEHKGALDKPTPKVR